jgi:hypothetical protein
MATTTELSNEYRRTIPLLESIKKVNGHQQYRKITKSLFGSKMHKQVRKRNEEKTSN